VRDASLPEQLRRAHEDHGILIAAEAARAHRDLFTRYRPQYTPRLREIILRGQRIGQRELEGVLVRLRQRIAVVEGLLDSFDLLLTPSAPGPAPAGLGATGDPRMSVPWTHVGVPTLTLPAALSREGLPLGVQLVGRRMGDGALLAAGAVTEEVLDFGETPADSSLSPKER